MKILLSTLLLCMAVPGGTALADEAQERQAVIDVVERFFKAMTANDLAASESVLTAEGILYGYSETADGLKITQPTHADYLAGIAGRETELVERMWDPQVLLHDRMAVVWTPYDFYIDGVFSHCGIDNFSLLKTDDGWKISGVVYSREKENCPNSPLGPLGSKQ